MGRDTACSSSQVPAGETCISPSPVLACNTLLFWPKPGLFVRKVSKGVLAVYGTDSSNGQAFPEFNSKSQGLRSLQQAVKLLLPVYQRADSHTYVAAPELRYTA